MLTESGTDLNMIMLKASVRFYLLREEFGVKEI